MHRLLVPADRLVEGEVTLDEAASHKLLHVLRLSIGATLEVFDGAGRSARATIVSLGTGAAVLRVEPAQDALRAAPITLAQGLPKGDKFELVLQKATELGAARVVPLALSRSVVRLDAARAASKLTRWKKIAEEAARQSGRADVPTLDEPSTLSQFLAAAKARGERVALLYEGAVDGRLSAFLEEAEGAPLALVVGPEGGLSDEELSEARTFGAAIVGLGPRILRTETAGLAALCVVLHARGELG